MGRTGAGPGNCERGRRKKLIWKWPQSSEGEIEGAIGKGKIPIALGSVDKGEKQREGELGPQAAEKGREKKKRKGNTKFWIGPKN